MSHLGRIRQRLHEWRLVLRWSWRHRKLLDQGERMVARTNPSAWFLPEDLQPGGFTSRHGASRGDMVRVHRYLAEKHGVKL